ncbi:hypothetical protein [Methylocapsa palsarum]|uniref:hypothetical protein n=1 Tax=Methylocapsa palsarum TaxID=1612308 RepID=UPI001113D2DC|nr:hypothetical protein [Methylocapsa palsarum]
MYASEPADPGLVAGVDSWDQRNVWTIPIYTAGANDPLQPLLYNSLAWYKVFTGEWKRVGNSAAVEADILASSKTSFPYRGNVFSTTTPNAWTLPASYNETVSSASPPARFRIGAGMTPAIGTDGHMVVFQPVGTALETYATIVLSSGPVVALSYATTSTTSAGDGWQNGQTASMLPAYAGLFCDEDVATGLNHALAITVPPTLLAPQIAYPAYAFDRDSLINKQPYAGVLPMGSRLALPPSVSVASLALSTAAGKAIATAAKAYGFIIVDRGGTGVTIRVKPKCATSDSVLRAWNYGLQNDLNAILAKVRSVTW